MDERKDAIIEVPCIRLETRQVPPEEPEDDKE